MLKLLRINNIALVESVEIELGAGLTLLTGETGAGKSILIDALGLVLGERASTELIRTGEDVGTVEAVFESPEIGSLLEARGLPTEGSEVIVRREIATSGKGRGSVNGALVPTLVLRELGAALVTLHGQNDSRDLLNSDTHGPLLDHHANLTAEVEALGAPYWRLREIESSLASLRKNRDE